MVEKFQKNFLEMNANKTNSNEANLPENMQKDYSFEVRGAGIHLMFSKLYMYGGIICNNEGIINTDIYSNKNSTNNNSKEYGIYQRCFGAAIFAEDHSKIYLYKGEISNNYSRNNAKYNLIEPIEKTITNLNFIHNEIYGGAISIYFSELEMFDDFTIQNNYSLLNPTLNIEKNCKISEIKNMIR